MLAKDGKKEPKIKKATNLRIFDILNEQAQERSTKKAAHNTSKVEVKGTLKGKKIDNKTLLHQFRQHVGMPTSKLRRLPCGAETSQGARILQ